MPTANVIQLRQLLKEKFPGLRTRLDDFPPPIPHWPTGLPQIDQHLHGGLPKGALTEIVVTRAGVGGALLMASLLRQAARQIQIVALIDGRDSFEVTQIEEEFLSRLLWVRCHSVNEALKAADLLLRDGNLPLLLLDLAANPGKEVRKIPATTWYRFQRLVEQTSTVCAVLTPQAMVAPAQARVTLRSPFSIDALERDGEELLGELNVEISETRHASEAREALQNSA